MVRRQNRKAHDHKTSSHTCVPLGYVTQNQSCSALKGLFSVLGVCQVMAIGVGGWGGLSVLWLRFIATRL